MAKKGHTPWNKGLTKETDERVRKNTIGIKNYQRTEEHQKNINNSLKGVWDRNKHPNLGKRGVETTRWKGGKTQGNRGYIMVLKQNHPFCNSHGRVAEHRLVMEEHLGRYLAPFERVHHIDFDKTNNQIENLHLFFNDVEHKTYHCFLENCVKGILMEV